MAGDKTAVEHRLMKQEPIGQQDFIEPGFSSHCIRSSNKNEEQQNNSIHIKSQKNS